jgi:hypothetical protein
MLLNPPTTKLQLKRENGSKLQLKGEKRFIIATK